MAERMTMWCSARVRARRLQEVSVARERDDAATGERFALLEVRHEKFV